MLVLLSMLGRSSDTDHAVEDNKKASEASENKPCMHRLQIRGNEA